MARKLNNLLTALDLVNRLEYEAIARIEKLVNTDANMDEQGAVTIEQIAKAVAKLRVEIYNSIGDVDGDPTND